MKLCYGDERARWGPAACPGWARASERERASLTGGRCNPAILPDTAHQNVPTTPLELSGQRPIPRGACDHSDRCAQRDGLSQDAFVAVTTTRTLFCRGCHNHDKRL